MVPTTLPTLAPPSLRPSAHFTAQDTWLNDPNGLLYHDGTYHLFFQNNPYGNTWGNISWGHATSTDLVTWDEHKPAILATDGEMAFSGSAVVDTRNTAGFANVGETSLVAIYTSARHPDHNQPASQTQSLAYSLDDGANWTRYPANPVLDNGSPNFRDPKVFWYGDQKGHWVMVAVEATDRRVVIYTSADLISWHYTSDFGPAHAVGGVWECPDLFQLPVAGTNETRWALVVSLNPGGIAGGSGTQYFIGDFNGARFVAEHLTDSTDPADYDWLDYGCDYYAGVSFNNAPDGRRLMIGWASNWQYANQTPTHPWRSAMSLVREVHLVRCADGRLRLTQQPILPTHPTDVQVFDVSIACASGDCTTLTLTSTNGGGERFVITVDGDERSITCDRTHSGDTDFHPEFPSMEWAPIPPDNPEEIDLRIVVDATIIEVYAAGGLITFTEQVFPTTPLTHLSRERLTGVDGGSDGEAHRDGA